MSRTIRRTRGYQPELYSFKECKSLKGNTYTELTYLKKGDPEYSKEYWKVHSDHGSGTYGVPRWFRAVANQLMKSDEAKKFRRAMRLNQEDELVFNPRKKNAGYDWW